MNKLFSISIFLFIVGIHSIQAQSNSWTLAQCVNYAIDNDLALKEIQLNQDFYQKEITNAYGNLLPNANAYADHQYNFGSVIDPTTNARVSSDIQSNSFSFSSNVELFNWSNFVRIKVAKLQKSKATYEAEIKKNELIIRIVQVFNQIQFDKEQLALIQEQLKNTESNLKRIQIEVELGNKAKSDLYEVLAQKAIEEQALTNAKNAFKNAQTQLLNLLNLREEIDFVQEMNSLQALSEETLTELYEKGIQVRPEIKSAEIQTEIAEKNLAQQRSNYLPKITGNYSLSSFYVDVETSAFKDQIKNNKTHYLGISLSVPIFNRLQTKMAIQQRKIELEQSNLQLEQQKQAYFNALRDAFTKAQNAYDSWQMAEISLEAQNIAFTKNEEKFKQGMIDSYGFFAAKNNLLNAQTNLLQAKYTYLYESILLNWYVTNELEF